MIPSRSKRARAEENPPARATFVQIRFQLRWLPFPRGLTAALIQVNMVVDLLHPAHGDQVVHPVRAVVFGELDLVPLDAIDLAKRVAA